MRHSILSTCAVMQLSQPATRTLLVQIAGAAVTACNFGPQARVAAAAAPRQKQQPHAAASMSATGISSAAANTMATTTTTMNHQSAERQQPKADDGNAQQQQQQQAPVATDAAAAAAAQPTAADTSRTTADNGIDPSLAHTALERKHPNQLMEERNKVLWEQATRGEQPGLMLIQDALSGENKAQTWGNVPEELEHQN